LLEYKPTRRLWSLIPRPLVSALWTVKLVILVGMEQRTLGLATRIRPFIDNVTRTIDVRCSRVCCARNVNRLVGLAGHHVKNPVVFGLLCISVLLCISRAVLIVRISLDRRLVSWSVLLRRAGRRGLGRAGRGRLRGRVDVRWVRAGGGLCGANHCTRQR
jgi:hypothetical protein